MESRPAFSKQPIDRSRRGSHGRWKIYVGLQHRIQPYQLNYQFANPSLVIGGSHAARTDFLGTRFWSRFSQPGGAGKRNKSNGDHLDDGADFERSTKYFAIVSVDGIQHSAYSLDWGHRFCSFCSRKECPEFPIGAMGFGRHCGKASPPVSETPTVCRCGYNVQFGHPVLGSWRFSSLGGSVRVIGNPADRRYPGGCQFQSLCIRGLESIHHVLGLCERFVFRFGKSMGRTPAVYNRLPTLRYTLF